MVALHPCFAMNLFDEMPDSCALYTKLSIQMTNVEREMGLTVHTNLVLVDQPLIPPFILFWIPEAELPGSVLAALSNCSSATSPLTLRHTMFISGPITSMECEGSKLGVSRVPDE